MRKLILFTIIIVVIVVGGRIILDRNQGVINVPPDSSDPVIQSLQVPTGFRIDIYASDLPGARVMAFDPNGRLVISQTKEGKITAVSDKDNDGLAENKVVLAENLNDPHGLAFDCRTDSCFLYVAEHNALSRYVYDAETPSLGAREKLLDLSAALTDRHTTRTLLFLEAPDDDTLLISVGSSCDVCEDSGMRGKIISYNVRTGQTSEYATGLRNAVFMTLHPVSGKVYVTEMGRDGLGDNLPPDEVNVLEEGGWYGWPWFYGKSVFDEKFRPGVMPGFAEEAVPSFIDIPAHSAPLGITFIQEEGWPEEYWFNALVAYHGSWNRSEPTGYKIVRAKMNARREFLGLEDFITGWLTEGGEKLGRPVDIIALPGGVIYITDDQRGVVYRVTRQRS